MTDRLRAAQFKSEQLSFVEFVNVSTAVIATAEISAGKPTCNSPQKRAANGCLRATSSA